MISIQHLSKVELLFQMWKNQKVASFFTVSRTATPVFDPVVDQNKALEAIAQGYIDYFMGRAIKTDLSKDTISSSYAYDLDAGEGTLERIVAAMRPSESQNEEEETEAFSDVERANIEEVRSVQKKIKESNSLVPTTTPTTHWKWVVVHDERRLQFCPQCTHPECANGPNYVNAWDVDRHRHLIVGPRGQDS